MDHPTSLAQARRVHHIRRVPTDIFVLDAWVKVAIIGRIDYPLQLRREVLHPGHIDEIDYDRIYAFLPSVEQECGYGGADRHEAEGRL